MSYAITLPVNGMRQDEGNKRPCRVGSDRVYLTWEK